MLDLQKINKVIEQSKEEDREDESDDDSFSAPMIDASYLKFAS